MIKSRFVYVLVTGMMWRSIQQNKRLRFIGFCRYTYPGAGGQYEIENISGNVARRFTKISRIVGGIDSNA